MIAEYIYDLLPENWPKVIGELPSANAIVVGIVEYDGATSTEYFGPKNLSSILEPIIKIVIRHTSYSEGQQWANTVRDMLHRYHDDFLLSVLIVGSPVYLGKNSWELHEFQVTFKTQVQEPFRIQVKE